jgi:hypothetical protein
MQMSGLKMKFLANHASTGQPHLRLLVMVWGSKKQTSFLPWVEMSRFCRTVLHFVFEFAMLQGLKK